MAEEKKVAKNDAGELTFNGGIIARNSAGYDEKRIVKDRTPDGLAVIIKFPGGMMELCDLDQECFLKEIERLARLTKFSDSQIKTMLEIESQQNRKPEERGTIRENLEEVHVYVNKMTHAHYRFQPAQPADAVRGRKAKDPVHYNFFFIEEYVVPEHAAAQFVSTDADVQGRLWVSDDELLSSGPRDAQTMKIIYTHKLALLDFKNNFKGRVSREVVLKVAA